MSGSSFAGRVAGVGDEQGTAIGALVDFFPASLPVATSLQEAMEPVLELCASTDLGCSPASLQVAIDVATDFGADLVNFQNINYLTRAEAAALALYTMDGPFYLLLNAKLRDRDRNKLRSFIAIIWLLMHAIRKCPPCEQHTVYRGVKRDLSASYPNDRTVTWNAFSSCSLKVETLENEQFMGTFGERTLFSIQLTTGRCRNISACSMVPQEAEVLLPLNTRLKVCIALFVNEFCDLFRL